MLAKQERGGEAEPFYREALSIRRRTLGQDHPNLAYPLLGLARVLMDQGKVEEAQKLLVECLDIRRSLPPAAGLRLAQTESAFGRCLTMKERYAEAEPYLRSSCHAIIRDPTASSREKREALENVIALYQAWDRPAEARAYGDTLDALEGDAS